MQKFELFPLKLTSIELAISKSVFFVTSLIQFYKLINSLSFITFAVLWSRLVITDNVSYF